MSILFSIILFFHRHLISFRNWKTQALFRHNIFICVIYCVALSLIFKKVVVGGYWVQGPLSLHFIAHAPAKSLESTAMERKSPFFFTFPGNQASYPSRVSRFSLWKFLINLHPNVPKILRLTSDEPDWVFLIDD